MLSINTGVMHSVAYCLCRTLAGVNNNVNDYFILSVAKMIQSWREAHPFTPLQNFTQAL